MANIKDILEVKKEHIIADDITLEDSISIIKERILERSTRPNSNDNWEQGYTQALIDAHHLLVGLELWKN